MYVISNCDTMESKGVLHIKHYFRFFVFILISVIFLNACKTNDGSEDSSIVMSETSTTVVEKGEETVYTSKTYKNKGKMSDTDGPAVCIYTTKGCNKAQITVDLEHCEMSLVRADGRHVNAYVFLGIDIYDENGSWINCLDAGFCKSGAGGEWHIFYNLFDAPEGARTWYESKVGIKKGVYVLELDSSSRDGYATVKVKTTDGKVVDTKNFPAKGAKADGSNTSYLQNYALDFPQNLILDTNGNKTDNFVEVVLYNTNQDLYFRNINVTDARLWYSGEEVVWTKEQTTSAGIWPDKQCNIGYDAVRMFASQEFFDLKINLDMNYPMEEDPN